MKNEPKRVKCEPRPGGRKTVEPPKPKTRRQENVETVNAPQGITSKN